MDWYPMMNTLRIALAATSVVVLIGIPAAYYASRLPRPARLTLDVVLMLPLVLPPTVLGWLVLSLIGERGPLGFLSRALTGNPLILTWQAAACASAAAAFPLMYRFARKAFDGYNRDLDTIGLTLGRSRIWVFWAVRLGACWRGLLSGAVLSFARAAGEFGATFMAAGYTPGRTATVSTTVYRLWTDHSDGRVAGWVTLSLIVSAVFLAVLVILESRQDKNGGAGGWN